MKRIALLITALLVSLTAFAQVGRYKNINLLYPGYSFKFDTATGELWVVHYENEAEIIMEEEISPKQILSDIYKRRNRNFSECFVLYFFTNNNQNETFFTYICFENA